MQLTDILNQFEPISLKEMEEVKLMNRMDTKFMFNASQLMEVLSLVKNDYYILEIEHKRQSFYKTLYYDTKNYDLYLNHHNGHLNRYKIRHRTYIDSDTGFLEVKFKSNKGRTIKERIESDNKPLTWQNESKEFIGNKTPYLSSELVPALWVNYNRITLVNKNKQERVTIDIDLEFVNEGHTKKLFGLIIAEVKQDKKTASAFLNKMKELHIRQGSISKYCMGMAITRPELKQNNFKKKLVSLKHIVHDNKFNIASC